MRSLIVVLCLVAGSQLAFAAPTASPSQPSARTPTSVGAKSPAPASSKKTPQKAAAPAPKPGAAVTRQTAVSSAAKSRRVPVNRPRVTTRSAKRAVPAPSGGGDSGRDGGNLSLASGSALIIDQGRNQVLYQKNSDARLPIASITKLMTAMVVLDAKQPLFEEIEVNEEDVDWLKGSRSRLPLGSRLTRHELLYLALMASENRAASALARSYPGGKPAFVLAMNRMAHELGMTETRFADPTGLDPGNTSTAQDLAQMVRGAYEYPLIRQITTTPSYTLALPRRTTPLEYINTNRLVRAQTWEIGLSKTGYINEAGRCLVMQADIADRPLLIVLLNGGDRATPFVDVTRLRQWLEKHPLPAEPALAARTLG
jgi:D-alanyl-D-alanine endopeptidase (penicillin-binding protein 7)